MRIDYYFIYFVTMSFMGWVYESLAMTVWHGNWENRGFLYGPIIPIYGLGATIGTMFFRFVITDYSYLKVFLVSFVASFILEYSISWRLEKLFHAYWWDYSIAPLNINGRVCLPASLGFGLAGIIIIYLINPKIWPLIDSLSAVTAKVLATIFLIILVADTTLNVTVLSSFDDKVIELDRFINEHVDNLVSTVNPKGKNLKGAIYDNRERYVDESIDNAAKSMGYLSNNVIRRVMGFRQNGKDKIAFLKNKINRKLRGIRENNER